VPPDDAPRLCGGHVTAAPGADGEAGAHIEWSAYTSPEAPEHLAARYARSHGPSTREPERDCDVWRRPAASPRQVVEICAIDEPGPWSDCSAAPPGSESIVLISSRSGPDR
jgi:hypothetical protein